MTSVSCGTADDSPPAGTSQPEASAAPAPTNTQPYQPQDAPSKLNLSQDSGYSQGSDQQGGYSQGSYGSGSYSDPSNSYPSSGSSDYSGYSYRGGASHASHSSHSSHVSGR